MLDWIILIPCGFKWLRISPFARWRNIVEAVNVVYVCPRIMCVNFDSACIRQVLIRIPDGTFRYPVWPVSFLESARSARRWSWIQSLFDTVGSFYLQLKRHLEHQAGNWAGGTFCLCRLSQPDQNLISWSSTNVAWSLHLLSYHVGTTVPDINSTSSTVGTNFGVGCGCLRTGYWGEYLFLR